MKTITMKTNFKLNPLFFACLFVGAQFSGLNLITNEAKAQTTNNQGSSANQTFKTEREDFSNSQDYDRNLKGECDSTCDLVPPYVPPFNGTSEYLLSPPIAVSEEQQITCQEEGHPSDWLGRVLQRRTYISQNGVRVPGTETPWVTFDDNCRAPYPCTDPVTWGTNNWCTGTPNIASGATGLVNSSTSGITGLGSATYSCFDGTATYVSGTCNIPCSDSTISWTSANGVANCSTNVSQRNHGTLLTGVAATTGSGDVSLRCTNGSWSVTASSCTERIDATGCDITTATISGQRYRIHTCRPEHNGQRFTVINPGSATETIDYLVVGGGGGGGAPRGGGGGAGGFFQGNIRIDTAAAYSFYVGSGGAAGIAANQSSNISAAGHGGHSTIFSTFVGGGAPGSHYHCGNGAAAHTAAAYGVNTGTTTFVRGSGGGAGGCLNEYSTIRFTSSGGAGLHAGGGNQGALAGGGGGGSTSSGVQAQFRGSGWLGGNRFLHGVNNILGYGGAGSMSSITGVNRMYSAGGDPGGIAGTCLSGSTFRQYAETDRSNDKIWVCSGAGHHASKNNGNCKWGDSNVVCNNNSGRGGDGGDTTTIPSSTWSPGGRGSDGVIILRYRIN